MPSFKHSRGGVDRLDIQRSKHLPRVVTLERSDDVGVVDAIAIGLGGCAEARVKIGRDLFSRYGTDVRRQPRVERARQNPGFDRAIERTRGHLAERMDARVGPTGAMEDDLAAVELAKGLLDQALHGSA